MANISQYIYKDENGNETSYNLKDRYGDLRYTTCTTSANTKKKSITIDGIGEITTGTSLHVKFTASNTATSPTLSIVSDEQEIINAPIYRYDNTIVSTTPDTSWNAGAIITLTYDGTKFIMNDVSISDVVSQKPITTQGTYPLLSTYSNNPTSAVTNTVNYNTGVALRPKEHDLAITVDTTEELYDALVAVEWWREVNVY